jgi:hypothetical protein
VIDTTYELVHTSEKTNRSLITKAKKLKTFRKMIAFCSENGMKSTNALWAKGRVSQMAHIVTTVF